MFSNIYFSIVMFTNFYLISCHSGFCFQKDKNHLQSEIDFPCFGSHLLLTVHGYKPKSTTTLTQTKQAYLPEKMIQECNIECPNLGKIVCIIMMMMILFLVISFPEPSPCGVCSPCCQMCSTTSLIKHNYHLCPHRSPFILLCEEKQL